MKCALFLLILFVFVGCNSKEAQLGSIQGLRDPSDPFPFITSVTLPPNGIYSASAVLDFNVTFSEVVLTDLTPRLPIITESGTYYADYLSGSGTDTLTFRLTVSANSFDANGIQLATLQLNGGSIYDPDDDDDAKLAFSSPDTSLIRINAMNFGFSSIEPPPNGYYKTGSNLDFKINYTGPITVDGGIPQLNFIANSITKHAMYVSGSGTSQLIFRYVVQAGETANGINASATGIVFNGSTLLDPFGGSISSSISAPGTLSGIKIDGVNPTSLVYYNLPSDGAYYPGQYMSFSQNFSENLVVTGNPRLKIQIGSSTRYADYNSTAGSAVIFSYTVQAGDTDSSGGIQVDPLIDLSSGSITDIAGNAYIPSTISTYTNSIIVDSTPATISGVSVIKLGAPPYTFRKNENIDVQVNMNGAARCSASPQPYIEMNIGGIIKRAYCTTTILSSQLIFRYSVEAGLKDTDGIVVASNVNMNGGYIKDGNVDVSNSSTGTFTGFTDNQALVNSFTYITGVSVINGMRSYQPGEPIDLRVFFSDTITVTGSPEWQSTIGVSDVLFTQLTSDSTSITFRHLVTSADLDWDGIVFDGSISGGTIKDVDLQLVERIIPSNFAPRIFAVPQNMNQWYDIGDISFVSVSGTPQRVNTIRNKTTGTGYNISGTTNPLYLDDGQSYGMQFQENNAFNVGLQSVSNIMIVYTTVPTIDATDRKIITSGSNYFSFRNETLAGDSIITPCSSCTYYDGSVWQGSSNILLTSLYFLDPIVPVANEKRLLSLKVPTGSNTFSLGNSFIGGTIHEVITFSSNPTAADLTKVHTYLKAKHNVDF